MSAGNGNRNGDTTPPDPTPNSRLNAAEWQRKHDEIARLDARQLAERACRDAFAASVEAGVAVEYAKANEAAIKSLGVKVDGLAMQHASDTGQIMGELGRMAKNLGMVERRASRPDEYAAKFADLHLEGEITKMNRVRSELAHTERLRVEALQRRADLWSGAKRIARLAVAAAIVVAPIVWIALKGWIE